MHVIIWAGSSYFCWYATQGFLQAIKYFGNTKAIGIFSSFLIYFFFFLLVILQRSRSAFSAPGLVREIERLTIAAVCKVSLRDEQSGQLLEITGPGGDS